METPRDTKLAPLAAPHSPPEHGVTHATLEELHRARVDFEPVAPAVPTWLREHHDEAQRLLQDGAMKRGQLYILSPNRPGVLALFMDADGAVQTWVPLPEEAVAKVIEPALAALAKGNQEAAWAAAQQAVPHAPHLASALTQAPRLPTSPHAPPRDPTHLGLASPAGERTDAAAHPPRDWTRAIGHDATHPTTSTHAHPRPENDPSARAQQSESALLRLAHLATERGRYLIPFWTPDLELAEPGDPQTTEPHVENVHKTAEPHSQHK